MTSKYGTFLETSFLFLGGMFHDVLPEGGSLRILQRILTGERMSTVPNGSMSVIDVRDLAELELAALTKADASGRYFGVLASYHWKDILAAMAKARPKYKVPAAEYAGEDAKPTQFDTTRRDSLGVKMTSLEDMITFAVQDLEKREAL